VGSGEHDDGTIRAAIDIMNSKFLLVRAQKELLFSQKETQEIFFPFRIPT